MIRTLFPSLKKTVDKKNPREWYWALLEYGTVLAQTVDNPNKKSKHYAIQSKFIGSNRQIRGAILKEIVKRRTWNIEHVYSLPFAKERIDYALTSLQKEGFVMEKNGKYSIK